MEDEKIFSGYCRRIDRSRMVTVELLDGRVDHVDCGFADCVYRPSCPIASEIEKLQ